MWVSSSQDWNSDWHKFNFLFNIGVVTHKLRDVLVKWKALSYVRLFAISPWKSPGQNTFSRGSSQPRDWTQASHIAGRFFTSWATGKPENTGVGSLSLLQGIFPTQGLNPGLPHCRRILYQLSHKRSPLTLRAGYKSPLSHQLHLHFIITCFYICFF